MADSFQGKSIINLPENLAGCGTGLKWEMETPGEKVEIKGKEKVMEMHLESGAYRQMAKKSEEKYRMLLPQREVKYTCIRSIDSNSI